MNLGLIDFRSKSKPMERFFFVFYNQLLYENWTHYTESYFILLQKLIDFIGPEIILSARGYTAKIADTSIQTLINELC